MATRQDVETAIEAIENGGNNTAKEVREVLTFLLNYTENVDQESDLKPFENNNFKKPVKSGANAQLLYSFRGFENFSVNFTLGLKMLKKNDGEFSFKLEPNLFPKLKKIITQNGVSFVVPVIRRENNTGTTAIPIGDSAANSPNIVTKIMFLGLQEPDQLTIRFQINEMSKSDIIFTSIQLHVPDFFDD